MLIFVLIANGPLQTVISQFALGASLKLSGLVVLFATTGGAILAGVLGGIFAAPFVKIGVDAYRQLKEAGLFDDGRRWRTGRRMRRAAERREAARRVSRAGQGVVAPAKRRRSDAGHSKYSWNAARA